MTATAVEDGEWFDCERCGYSFPPVALSDEPVGFRLCRVCVRVLGRGRRTELVYPAGFLGALVRSCGGYGGVRVEEGVSRGAVVGYHAVPYSFSGPCLNWWTGWGEWVGLLLLFVVVFLFILWQVGSWS